MSEKWVTGQALVHRDGATSIFASATGVAQETWERNGWRAVVPAPPVEGALAAGWEKKGAGEFWLCTNSRRHGYDDQVTAAYAVRARCTGACEACAEEMGVFASPEPKAEAAKPCADWCGTGECPEGVDHWGEEAWCSKECARVCRRPKSAPVVGSENWIEWHDGTPVVEKPRPLTCFCGSVELVAMRVMLPRRGPQALCQRCYLKTEQGAAKLMVDGDKLLADPKPRPAAHPGVSPVVFGLSVGILGARGMRSGR